MARRKLTYTPPKAPSAWPKRIIFLLIVGALGFYLWTQRDAIAQFARQKTPVARKTVEKTLQQTQSNLSPLFNKAKNFSLSSFETVKEHANVALRKLGNIIKENSALRRNPSQPSGTQETKPKAPTKPAGVVSQPSVAQTSPFDHATPPPQIDNTAVTQYRGPPKTSNPQDYKPHAVKNIELPLQSQIQSDEKPLPGPANTELTIASFNIRIFSDNSRTDQELGYIAAILKRYDIIAIQELRDEKVLQRTIGILGQMGYPFGYDISPPVGKKIKERYAFVYRKDKITIKQPGQLYRMNSAKFIREPYFATFQSGQFDFTLLTIHLLFGNSKEERRPELTELAQAYNHVQDLDPDEQDVILLGDFNFDPDDHGWQELKKMATMLPLLNAPVKTTITDTSLYDNFWFQRKYVKEYSGQTGVVKFDENIFNNDDERAKLAVSDHRPIWARFHVEFADDD